MNSSTFPHPSWPAMRATHSPWLAALAVAGAFGLFASAQALWPSGGEAGLDADAPSATAAPAGLPPVRLRCETCGVVEAIDRTEAVDGLPAAWVFSVRMRDGSLRLSTASLPGRWQVGDSMQLIGGGTTWSKQSLL